MSNGKLQSSLVAERVWPSGGGQLEDAHVVLDVQILTMGGAQLLEAFPRRQNIKRAGIEENLGDTECPEKLCKYTTRHAARLIRNAMSPPRQAYTACFFLFVFFLYRLRFSALFQFLCIFASPYLALTPMSASHSSPPSLFSLLAFKLNAFSIECLLSLALHLLTNPAFRMLPSGQTDSRV